MEKNLRNLLASDKNFKHIQRLCDSQILHLERSENSPIQLFSHSNFYTQPNCLLFNRKKKLLIFLSIMHFPNLKEFKFQSKAIFFSFPPAPTPRRKLAWVVHPGPRSVPAPTRPRRPGGRLQVSTRRHWRGSDPIPGGSARVQDPQHWPVWVRLHPRHHAV